MEDLVPFIRRDCASGDIRIATSGASLGAFYAANFAAQAFRDVPLCPMPQWAL